VHKAACVLWLFALGACAPGRDLPELQSTVAGVYHLGPGDVVRLITYGEDQLTGEFRVSDAGTVSLPLLGSIKAAGLSPDELAAQVGEALIQASLLKLPSVSAEIVAYRPVFVMGEVSKPGQYAYQPGMTMATAAAVAGGFTYRAVQDYASVIRIDDGKAREAKARREAFVQPGDVITVYERRF
jgi:polysaccharide export outer membrane protein